MVDDERPNESGGGFDDWLDEEPGPDTDPYAALADEDEDEAEVSEWIAFSGSAANDDDDHHADDPAAEVDSRDRNASDDETGVEADGVAGEEPGPVSFSDGDETEEIPVSRPEPSGFEPATSVELADFDGGGRADTDEIPIIAAGDVTAVGADPTDTEPDVDDTDELPVVGDEAEIDTGELPVIAPGLDGIATAYDGVGGQDPLPSDQGFDNQAPSGASADLAAMFEEFDELVADDLSGEEPSGEGPWAGEKSGGESPDEFDPLKEDYPQTSTREHAGLAAAIAEADTEATERVALAAPIPGLESNVVGFEDVVEAEGHGRVRARASGDLVARIITAIVLIGALAASLVWRPALIALATVVFIIGAGEFYTALRRTGRQPIALFGFVGLLGASIGAFVWGAIAIPMAFMAVATVLLLFYAVVPGRQDPMANLALTITVMAWVGLGTYSMMIAVSEDYRTLIVGVVFTVAMMDIAQYFVGRTLGRHKLSPWVSPNKTVEGLVGGVIVALTIGALLHFFPPFELTSGLAIGASVALLVPLGDLAMSAAKRALDIKDMGSILPGHGGFLDRIDGLLFVIPAAWGIFVWAGIL
ncbi:MAG TPA: phosphatidate cytidylyltransferase [Acidimicrobiia bacterium]|nr:phosphatidate cytidylyltransferase [Acidimicrobiia bacterium]